jgi:hypothetical protein
MPGKEVSDEPAIEGPASTKAKARMKLKVRIWRVSDVACGAVPPFRCRIDNQPVFPDIYAKSRKRFRRRENCFFAGCPTKQFVENLKDFRTERQTELPPFAGRLPSGRAPGQITG